MKITWKDVKDEVCDLCFVDKSEFEGLYGEKLYSAANFVLVDLAQSVCPIKRQYRISHMPLENIAEMAGNPFEARQGGFCIYANNAAAYYFECDGRAEVFLEKEQDGAFETLETIKPLAANSFEAFCGFVNVSGRVRLRFSEGFAYNVRSVAFYSKVFGSTQDDIMPYAPYVRYDIKKLTKKSGGQDFMSFDERLPVYSALGRQPESSFAFEGDSVILLPRDKSGEYIVSYNAYPKKITASTPDEQALDIEPSAARLAALYIAFRVLKNDDAQKSALYYNEYSQQKNQTYNQTPQNEVWTSTEEW